MSSKPCILFVDAYDSFSHNMIALLVSHCGTNVTKICIDAVIPDLENFLSAFAAIICGPGPGHPARPQDVGLFKDIWALSNKNMIPVLGICLGFQSLAYEFGASVGRLKQPRHGIKTRVKSSSTSIFEGLFEIHTVQYHSLHVVLGRHTYGDQDVTRLWEPSDFCPELQPLAWEFGPQAEMDSKFRENPPTILMAVRHMWKPFYGIQFHPESICSESTARQVVINWWQAAKAWLTSNCPSRLESGAVPALYRLAPRTHEIEIKSKDTNWGACIDSVSLAESSPTATAASHQTGKTFPRLISATLPVGTMTIPSICDALRLVKDELIILDSEMRQLPHLGETSVIGIVFPNTKKLKYSVGARAVSLQQGDENKLIDLDAYGGDVFSFIKAFMADYAIDTHHDRPFCGGLMGYINYEACLETIGISVSAQALCPDICFAFIERNILIDHTQNLVHVQCLEMDESGTEVTQWLSETTAVLSALSKEDHFLCRHNPQPTQGGVIRSTSPRESEYRFKINQCQEKISAGESYELCLTDQSSISMAGTASSWDLYCNLRRLNPAPFASYIRLGPLTVLSTSPERFMDWSRVQVSPATADSREPEHFTTCQFRPIKGTVGKYQVRPDGSIHYTTRQEATLILATQKEQAENLMIVDLIRHDLYGVCQDVWVKDLMVIEEYEKVFQLVSVVEGRLSKSPSFKQPVVSGIDCLAASLPPGSMTGAPKRRSCQLLQKIENCTPRSIYSGVLGYICVSGKGDFSVVIRSVYQWDDCERDSTTWNIGAGGAITSLSTEDCEWEEMLTKLRSTYCLFDSEPL